MILQYLMRYHKTNNISQNFSGLTLGFCDISKFFVDLLFHFQYLWKMTAKCQFLSNRFTISKFRTFQWQKLKSQYCGYLLKHLHCQVCHVLLPENGPPEILNSGSEIKWEQFCSNTMNIEPSNWYKNVR